MAKSTQKKSAPAVEVEDEEQESAATAQRRRNTTDSGITVRIFKMKNEYQSKARPRGVDKLMVDNIPIRHALTEGWSYTKDGAFAGKPETDVKKSDDAVKAKERAEAAVANAKQAAADAIAHAEALQALE